MCGEKAARKIHKLVEQGSPPRVRGKVVHKTLSIYTVGITPACAGKRLTEQFGPCGEGDHPRVCGEKESSSSMCVANAGSPPRVRGKVELFCQKFVKHRITPACAGKSFPCLSFLSRIWDHPRVCGEKNPISIALCVGIGSPPRVRGKDAKPLNALATHRITPACAGKRK